MWHSLMQTQKVVRSGDVGPTPVSPTGKKVKDSEGGEDMRGDSRASIKPEAKFTDTGSKPATASDVPKKKATKEVKEAKDDKKLPLCPYGTGCYRWVHICVLHVPKVISYLARELL